MPFITLFVIWFQWELKFAASTYSNILLVPLSACKAIKNEPTLPRTFEFGPLACYFKASLVLIWLRVKLLTHGSVINSEFCFPETFNTEGKLNSLFPIGPIIKCFVLTPNWTYIIIYKWVWCVWDQKSIIQSCNNSSKCIKWEKMLKLIEYSLYISWNFTI